MILLSFAHFFLLTSHATSSDSLNWHVSSNWEQYDEFSWNLNAPQQGVYRLWGCASEPLTDFTMKFRWRQDLSGSNNNKSRFFITDSQFNPDSALYPLGTLELAIGRNGSDDPLVISKTESGIISEISPSIFNWAEPFDLDFTFRYSADSSLLSLRAGAHDSNWTIPIISVQTNIGATMCLGFEATCTSSQTEAFSWGLISLTQEWTPLPPLRLLSHTVINSTQIELEWSHPPSTYSSIWRNNTTLASQGSNSISSLNHRTTTSGLPPLTNGSSHQLRLQATNLDTTINVVWADSNSVEFRDVVITELMVDATPSVAYPETEWFELLNRTDKIVNLNGWSLIDDNQIRLIIPYNNWNGLLYPNGRVLVGKDPALWTSSGLVEGPLAQIPAWSGLNDNGESIIILRPDGTKIDEVTYNRSWWQGFNSAARSVSKIHPEGCSLASNWGPTFGAIGATPWSAAENEGPSSSLILPLSITAHQRTSHLVELSISPELDPISTPIVSLTSNTAWQELEWEDPFWVWNRITPLPQGKPISIELRDGRYCSNSSIISGTLQSWFPTLPPERGDLVISEFSPNPSSNSPWEEWVEIVNLSNRTLDLDGLLLGTGKLISNLSLGPEEYLVLNSNNVQPWNNLSSKEDIISLAIREKSLDIVHYSRCWHDNETLADGGHSLERLDNLGPSNNPENWASGVGQWGASPGLSRTDTIKAPSAQVKDSTVIWGIFEDRLAFLAPYSLDSCVLLSSNWSPQIKWEFIEAGQNQAIATSVWDGEESITCHAWKINGNEERMTERIWSLNTRVQPPPQPPVEEIATSHQLHYRINELLSNPLKGKSNFIEILFFNGATLGIGDLIWTTKESPQPSDWSHISEVDWWMPEGSVFAFSECPSWISNSTNMSVLMQADLPALGDGNKLSLASIISEEIDSVQIIDEEPGISRERINYNQDNWVSAPANKGGSSPGVENHASLLYNQFDIDSYNHAPLIIYPKTINLSADIPSKWVQIEWHPPANETHDPVPSISKWEVSISIYSINGIVISNIVESEIISGQGNWVWEGKSFNDVLVSHGTYVVMLHAKKIGGDKKKISKRELISVTTAVTEGN